MLYALLVLKDDNNKQIYGEHEASLMTKSGIGEASINLEGAIEISTLTWREDNERRTDRGPTIAGSESPHKRGELTFTKLVDLSSPQLWKHCLENPEGSEGMLKSAEFFLFKLSGERDDKTKETKPFVYMRITLEKLSIMSWDLKQPEESNIPVEEVKIQFEKATIRYQKQDPFGYKEWSKKKEEERPISMAFFDYTIGTK